MKSPFFALKNKGYTTHHKKDKEVLRIVLVGPPVSTVEKYFAQKKIIFIRKFQSSFDYGAHQYKLCALVILISR